MKLRDITGQRFGRLVAVRRIENLPGYGQARWLFRCDCGKDSAQFGYNVLHNGVVSCGCYADERRAAGAIHRTHGLNGTAEHLSWTSMRGRCRNPDNPAYHLYGGRGIRVCARWESFENFLADMGKRPSPQHSLDRIDPNGNYEPANCRWATKSEQVRNRRLSFLYEHMGRTLPLADWCDHFGLPYKVIWHRHKIGDRGDRLFRPIRYQRNQGRPS